MRRSFWSGAVMVLAVWTVARASEAPEADWQSFGGAFTLEKAVPAQEVLADPAAYAGKTLRFEGKVADVCRNKGCWMVVAEGDKSLRITMKDYGFFVPKDCSGALADLEGTLVEKVTTPEEAAHLAAESARPELAPKSGGEKSYEFVATAIRIKAR